MKKYIFYMLIFILVVSIGVACFVSISAQTTINELKYMISESSRSTQQASASSSARLPQSLINVSALNMKILPPINGEQVTVQSGENAVRMSDPWLRVEASAISENIQLESGSVSGKVELVDWFNGGAEIFKRYTEAVVIDVDTGRSINVRRFGGTFHADSYPLTSEDTAMMKEIVGGSWTWDRRAVWVKIGDRYFAASMHGMPHMTDPCPSNNFGGHFCIHFFHSRVHETSAECPKHQAMVTKAFTSSALLETYLENNNY